jgi:hypothetical protein
MATIRRIRGSFISEYVKPRIIERTVEQLIPTIQPGKQAKQSARRELDRRCGRDRRQQKQDVLLDLRSPHARRKQSRRDWEDDNSLTGIDTYA